MSSVSCLLGKLQIWFVPLSLFLFFFLLFFNYTTFGFGRIMLVAVMNGDAEKVAELMRQDPGFDVNKQDDFGYIHLIDLCI